MKLKKGRTGNLKKAIEESKTAKDALAKCDERFNPGLYEKLGLGALGKETQKDKLGMLFDIAKRHEASFSDKLKISIQERQFQPIEEPPHIAVLQDFRLNVKDLLETQKRVNEEAGNTQKEQLAELKKLNSLLADKANPQAVYIYLDQRNQLTSITMNIPEEVIEQITAFLEKHLQQKNVSQSERKCIIDSLKDWFVISGGMVSMTELLFRITDAILKAKGM